MFPQEMAMRKVTRTHFEDEDDDMVSATVWMHLLLWHPST